MAIQSALLVAPLLLRLVQNPVERGAIEREYRERHRTFFATRIAWSRRAALLLSRPRMLDAAMAAVRTPRVGEFFLRRTRGSREVAEQMAETFFARPR
jgi:hypothetical protein